MCVEVNYQLSDPDNYKDFIEAVAGMDIPKSKDKKAMGLPYLILKGLLKFKSQREA